MSKYPRSIRYALSTYSNNLKKERNKSESQRLYSQGNVFSNSLNNDNNSKISESLYPYPKENSIQNKYNYNINSEMDDVKNKTEARQLIEQTKKMMEEYSLNKLKKQNGSKNFINPKNTKTNFTQELPEFILFTPPIEKLEYEAKHDFSKRRLIEIRFCLWNKRN